MKHRRSFGEDAWVTFLSVFMLVLGVSAIAIGAGVLVAHSLPDHSNVETITIHYIPSKVPPCRRDDVCNGVASPARIQAHTQKENP